MILNPYRILSIKIFDLDSLNSKGIEDHTYNVGRSLAPVELNSIRNSYSKREEKEEKRNRKYNEEKKVRQINVP